MPGPLPKDQAVRQRRNKTTSAATLEAEPARKRRIPKLPARGLDENGQPLEWHAMTRAWWRDVWRSPMAAEYVQADLHGLYRLAVLVEEFWHFPTSALAAEIRLEQQCFGLTPLDRRRLQWEVSRVEEATSKRRPPAAAPPSQAPIDDPRAMFRIVGGSK